jgi:uncharacterized protein
MRLTTTRLGTQFVAAASTTEVSRMSFSMYDACIPVFTQMLGSLSAIIDKSAAHAAEKKIPEPVFLQARLYPDMFTLARQVRLASDFGRNAPGRLAGVKLPSFSETDGTSFAELKDRVGRSLDFVQGFGRDQLEGTEDKDIVWIADGQQRSMKGRAYLMHFSIPHFFFHVTTAYGILRHNGVDRIGKNAFIGKF